MEIELVWIGLGILLLLTICFFLVQNNKKEERSKDIKTINEGFQASSTFQGIRNNKVFKLGNHGLGYYLDK